MEKDVTSKVGDVLMHHMTTLMAGQLDELMHDYTDESVVMSPDHTFHGLAEIRAFFQASIAGTPPELIKAVVTIHQDIHGEVAYVVWKAEPFLKIATDTLVVHDGKILAQTFLMVP